MKSRNIRLVVILATVTLILLVINQFYWIQKDSVFQENLIEIQEKNQKQSKELFDTKVTLALVNVRDRLLSLSNESPELYLDPVKQITDEYFVASFYDTLNPDLLRNLLVEEFKAYNIKKVFEYGIYDCFTDSIIFDQYVDLSQDKNSSFEHSSIIEKWDHDGHYFGVYFPKEKTYLSEKAAFPRSLFLSTFAILLTMIIMGYAIIVILRQKKLSEVKTDFINNMTHELKTPIATIKLSSDVLLNSSSNNNSERIKQFASIIKTENNRLESQVEKVLQVAKLEENKIELSLKKLDLHKIITSAAKVHQVVVQQLEGYVSCDLEAENFMIYADEVHITNIIHNIIDNGIKYSKEQPLISIFTENDKNGISISISDDGIGMTNEQMSHVFEKFYRVPKGSVHDVKGFGIGLFYVKYVIEQHKGKVSVESKKNEGSTFTIWLPTV